MRLVRPLYFRVSDLSLVHLPQSCLSAYPSLALVAFSRHRLVTRLPQKCYALVASRSADRPRTPLSLLHASALGAGFVAVPCFNRTPWIPARRKSRRKHRPTP